MAKKPKSQAQVFSGDIAVSRNVLMSASDFDAFELNVIVHVLSQLRASIYTVNSIPDPGEFFVSFCALANRHGCRADFVERIRKLRQKEIRYSIETANARRGLVITGLFSSVVVAPGGVMARISPEAIPWLLYIGGGVGYTHVETDVFFQFKSVFHKRLYFLCCSKLYKGIAAFSIDIGKLREVLGVPESESTGVFKKRCLKEFQNILDEVGSMYRFVFGAKFKPTPRAGRPSLVGYELCFSVRPEFAKRMEESNPVWRCIKMIEDLYPYLEQKHPDMMFAADIQTHLKETDSIESFLTAMSGYTDKSFAHRANIMARILKDRFGIDVFTPRKKSG